MKNGSLMVHRTPQRWLFLLLAVSLVLGTHPVSAAQTVQQLTDNTAGEGWGNRHSTTSQGKVLWFDENDNVSFYDGTSASLVQAFDADDPRLDDLDDIVFALGSGSTPGQVVGGWRRGTDFGWVWVNDGTAPKLVQAINPIDETQPLNPEGIAIADGCVFMALQAFFGGQAVKHIFRIDPATGVGTNLTGSAPVPGLFSRITTSGCQAAWLFDDGTGTPKLHFYDGTTVTVIDSGDLGPPHLNQGRLVYRKKTGGISQILLYDSTLTSPAPVQLTFDTDPTKGNFFPRTDGRHVAWLHGKADGTDQDIILNGGLPLTNEETRPDLSANNEHPFQLQRGQLAWQDVNGVLRYADGGGVGGVDISPATTVETPWLADGFIAFFGLSQDGGTDTEIFLFTGTPPADASQPSPPLLVTATPGDGQVTVAWDRIIGASSYNLYYAEQSGVTKDTYQTLPGGTKIGDVTSPFTVTGLVENKTSYFVVTAIEEGVEGPNSREAPATLVGGLTWISVGGLSTFVFSAVAADTTDGSVAYAGGSGNGFNCKDADKVAGCDVYKTADGGFTWTPVTGALNRIDVRALAVNGSNVYAATRDFFGGPPSKILRSTDSGGSWEEVVPDGGSIGELNKSLAIDPITPTTLYAGDFSLPTKAPGDSFVIESTDGGETWVHLPEPTEPLGAEIRAYAIAIDLLTSGKLYAGGTGTPNLVKSTNGGATWTNVSPAPGFVYALAIDRKQPATLYAGEVDFTQTSLGVFKSPDGGRTWVQKNVGFPTPLPRINVLLVDPANPAYLHAGTDVGYFYSTDGGETWTAANDGLTDPFIKALGITASRHLIAATTAGLFLLDLSGPAPESCLGTGLSLLVGRVKEEAGIPDVTLTLKGPGGCTDTTTTNARGFYRFRQMAKGTYTVTPGKAGCTFTPPSREVTIGGFLGIAGFSGICP